MEANFIWNGFLKTEECEAKNSIFSGSNDKGFHERNKNRIKVHVNILNV